jgi:hypothetical protein
MRRHRPTGGAQMFSFLDAMVCTMGALLVLVHAFARHGEVQLTKSPEVKAARENLAAVNSEIETLEWRRENLRQMREKTQAQLNDERIKLSHVEDHQRRLLARLDELKAAAAEMDRLDTNSSTAERDAAADLDAARARLRQAQEALSESRKAAQDGGVSYSVVPYEGPNATRRRPIYIECRGDAIVLQPEGVELTAAEFAGYLGPGNPLAKAVRGIREYWARGTPAGTQPSEPYPLLLVRPEGIRAYYAARAALDSWGSDFGYELVGADWQLKFPQRDEQLAQLTRQIVADASARSRVLVESLSQMSKNRPRGALRATAHGGFVQERSRQGGGTPGVGGRGRGWDSIGPDWAQDDGEGAQGGSTAGSTAGGSAVGGSAPGGGGYPAGSSAGRYGGLAQQGGGSFEEGSNGGGFGDGTGRYEQGSGARETNGTAAGGTADRRSSDGKYGGQPGGQYAGRYGGADGTKGATGGGAQSSTSGGASSSSSNSSASSAGASGAAGSASSAGGDDPSQTVAVGMPTPNLHAPKKTSSMARHRGRDWGLPDAGSGAAPATRPILVECHNDQLVILPDERGRPAKQVRLGANTQESMDEFVSNVWGHMKGWGTAGKGLYWKPTLLMEVKPGAADRYAEVKGLLADSGLDVTERKPQAAARPSVRNPRSSVTK